jgi:hypothetical protein
MISNLCTRKLAGSLAPGVDQRAPAVASSPRLLGVVARGLSVGAISNTCTGDGRAQARAELQLQRYNLKLLPPSFNVGVPKHLQVALHPL